jgi:hypothetical protein
MDTFRTRIPPVLQQTPAPTMSRIPRRRWRESASLPEADSEGGVEEFGGGAVEKVFIFIHFQRTGNFLEKFIMKYEDSI